MGKFYEKKFAAYRIPDYLCSECARQKKGEWNTAEATFHMDFCGICEDMKQVTHKRNWFFPQFGAEWFPEAKAKKAYRDD